MDDSQAYEFSYALYLARQVDREAAQMIVEAAEAGLIGIEQATEALARLSGQAAWPGTGRKWITVWTEVRINCDCPDNSMQNHAF